MHVRRSERLKEKAVTRGGPSARCDAGKVEEEDGGEWPYTGDDSELDTWLDMVHAERKAQGACKSCLDLATLLEKHRVVVGAQRLRRGEYCDRASDEPAPASAKDSFLREMLLTRPGLKGLLTFELVNCQ